MIVTLAATSIFFEMLVMMILPVSLQTVARPRGMRSPVRAVRGYLIRGVNGFGGSQNFYSNSGPGSTECSPTFTLEIGLTPPCFNYGAETRPIPLNACKRVLTGVNFAQNRPVLNWYGVGRYAR